MYRMIQISDALKVIESVFLQLSVEPEKRDRSVYRNSCNNLNPGRDAHYQRLLERLTEAVANKVWELRNTRDADKIREARRYLRDRHGYDGSLEDWYGDIQFIGAYLILWVNGYYADDSPRCQALKGTYWFQFFKMDAVLEERMYEVIFVNSISDPCV